MLFKDKLYSIRKMEGVGETLHVSILIIRDHLVFKGHFPDNPVLPGVCTLHIIGELLSKYLDLKLRLVKSDSIKFINLVVPVENTILDYKFSISNKEENIVSVKCSVTNNEVEILKMKGSYLCQQN